MDKFLSKQTKHLRRPVEHTPSRSQGSTKKKKSESGAAEPTPEEVTVTPVVKRTTTETRKPSNENNKLEEDLSDVEELENLYDEYGIPPPEPIYVDNNAVSFRYLLTLELDSTLDQLQVVKQSITSLNKLLATITREFHFRKHSGYSVILPWSDTSVYKNRALKRMKSSRPFSVLLNHLREYVYGFGSPGGKKNETEVFKKYCRVQLAWVADDPPCPPLREQFQTLQTYPLPPSLHLRLDKCASQSKDPTIAVQFRQSLVRNLSNWQDKVHEDCLDELNSMIKRHLPKDVICGLKRSGLATGHPYSRDDPVLLSLECERTQETSVTRDLLNSFGKTSRKQQIKDTCSVHWIAIPYFKGQDIRSEKRYSPEYLEIKQKEIEYQMNTEVRYVSDIVELDSVAPSQFFLSKEVLKQLEQTIWDHNETPIRALLYDKVWDDTAKLLQKEWMDLHSTLDDTEATLQKRANKAIKYSMILERLKADGHDVLAPYDATSFPVPSPSNRTLRECLMSLKSRRHSDMNSAPFVFQSINKTDDGRVLFTYHKNNSEEAGTILDNIPLFIQHEMHLDPIFFVATNMLKMCQGNYYNPLTRTGRTVIAKSLIDQEEVTPNLRLRIPKGIRNSSVKEFKKIFKKENGMFNFSEDTDLESLAETVASFKKESEKVVVDLSSVMDLQTLLRSHHLSNSKSDEVSMLSSSSELSFDSKTSRARYEIEKRAEDKAQMKINQCLQERSFQQGLELYHKGLLTEQLATFLAIDFRAIQRHVENGNNTQYTSPSQIRDNEEILQDMEFRETELPTSGGLNNDPLDNFRQTMRMDVDESRELVQNDDLAENAYLQSQDTKQPSQPIVNNMDINNLSDKDEFTYDSDVTPPQSGSPNKMAAGSQNVGKSK